VVDHFDGDSTVLGFVEGTVGVAVEGRPGESLSRSHQDAEKSSRPERRRPRRPLCSAMPTENCSPLATRHSPHLLDSLDPRRVMEITFEVARLGESLSRRHKETEKSSCPPRCRRPLRRVFSFASFAPAHVALRAAFSRLPSQRPLACVQHFSIFLRASCMPDSNASLPSKTPAWI